MRVTWKLTAKRSAGRCKGANKKDIYRFSSHLFFFPGSFSLFRLWGLCIDLVIQHGDADWLTITPCIKLQLCPRIYSLFSPSSAIPRMCFTVRAPLVTNSSSALTCSLDLIRRLCVFVRVYDRRLIPFPAVPSIVDVSRSAWLIVLAIKVVSRASSGRATRNYSGVKNLPFGPFDPDGAFEWCRCIARGVTARMLYECHGWVSEDNKGERKGEVHRLINSFLIIPDN